MNDAVTLENEHVRLTVLPDIGSRVTSLIDKESGRDWLQHPPTPTASDADGMLGTTEAIGWDECFPTIVPLAAEKTAWDRQLSDHGELFGRPWEVRVVTGTRLTTGCVTADFTFLRTLDLDGRALTCTYEVTTQRNALPFVWAQHALLAVRPDDRVVLPGVKIVDAAYLTLDGEQRDPQSYAWPGPGGVLQLPLDRVVPAERRFAAKFFTKVDRSPVASVGSENGGWLDFSWDADEVSYLAVWLNYGGQTRKARLPRLAIEPTNAPTGDLAEALALNRATTMRRGRSLTWSTTMTMRHGAALAAT